MKLEKITICNFHSFGSTPTTVDLEDITYFIGPNGSGKTAILQALCRMFAFLPDLRSIKTIGSSDCKDTKTTFFVYLFLTSLI